MSSQGAAGPEIMLISEPRYFRVDGLICGREITFLVQSGSALDCLDKDTYYSLLDAPKLKDQVILESKFFSSVDLRSAFHQVRMDEDSKHLTTFVTHIGSYCFIRMPYGVVKALATFQKQMEKVLRHLHWHICMA